MILWQDLPAQLSWIILHHSHRLSDYIRLLSQEGDSQRNKKETPGVIILKNWNLSHVQTCFCGLLCMVLNSTVITACEQSSKHRRISVLVVVLVASKIATQTSLVGNLPLASWKPFGKITSKNCVLANLFKRLKWRNPNTKSGEERTYVAFHEVIILTFNSDPHFRAQWSLLSPSEGIVRTSDWLHSYLTKDGSTFRLPGVSPTSQREAPIISVPLLHNIPKNYLSVSDSIDIHRYHVALSSKMSNTFSLA